MAGMFANADWSSALQAALAGYMARQSPQVASTMFRSLDDKRRAAMEEQQYQRRRGDELVDYGKKQEIDAKYAQPRVNDTVADYEFIARQLGPEAAKRYLDTKTNPIVMTPMGPMPYSQVNPAPQAAPPGVTFTPLPNGGPTQPASGGFPSPF